MAWTLKRVDLPSYDQAVNGADYVQHVGFLDPNAGQFIASARVMKIAFLEWLAEAMLALHWRFRHHDLDKSPYNLPDYPGAAPTKSARNAAIRRSRGDLEIRGRPLTEVDTDTLSECRAITMERHQAANWLVGTASLYSEVTCDT